MSLSITQILIDIREVGKPRDGRQSSRNHTEFESESFKSGCSYWPCRRMTFGKNTTSLWFDSPLVPAKYPGAGSAGLGVSMLSSKEVFPDDGADVTLTLCMRANTKGQKLREVTNSLLCCPHSTCTRPVLSVFLPCTPLPISKEIDVSWRIPTPSLRLRALIP